MSTHTQTHHRPLSHTLSHKALTNRCVVELAPVVQVVAIQVLDGPQLVLPAVQAERLVPQLVPREVRRRVLEARRPRRMEVAQRALAPPEVVVDAEALLVRIERAQLAQEREVLLRVLV